MQGIRPIHGVRVAATTVGLLLLWAAVAHESGSAWVQAVGAAVAALALIGLVAPACVMPMIRPVLLSAPTDGESGGLLSLVVACNHTCRIEPHHPSGEVAAAVRGSEHPLLVRPQRRGLLSEVVVDVRTAWPFGLLWWTRRLALALPREVHVHPRVGEPLPHPDLAGPGGGRVRAPATLGEVRSTRDYRPGDDRRSVHWPLSAHAGGLVVVSRDEPARRRTATLRADLPADPDRAEERAGRLLGTARELLALGVPVVLVSYESGRGLVAEAVLDARQAGRRLALAAPAGETADRAAGMPAALDGRQ